MFTKIENAKVLIKSKQGYKVLELYKMHDESTVFAKNGQYYIAILVSGVTSNANLTWTKLSGISENFVKGRLSV